MVQQRLIQLLIPVPCALILVLRRRQQFFPLLAAVLPALVLVLLLLGQQIVLCLQRLPLLTVLRQRSLPQLRHQRRQLLQIPIVRLLPRRLRIAGAIPAGQRRRLAQRVLHGRRTPGGVQLRVPLIVLVLLRIVLERLAPGDLVIQRLQLLAEPGLIPLRLQRRHAVPVLSGRRHLIRGRIALLQLLQAARRAFRHLRAWSGCLRSRCIQRRLLLCRGRCQQASPRLVTGDAVHHAQPVLLLIVPHGGSCFLAKDTVLVQAVPSLVQLALQLLHRAALGAVSHHRICGCHFSSSPSPSQDVRRQPYTPAMPVSTLSHVRPSAVSGGAALSVSRTLPTGYASASTVSPFTVSTPDTATSP